jgi:2-aminoadipate transaminase
MVIPQDTLSLLSYPNVLSFVGGSPAPELFPVTEYAQATAHVLATERNALQYGSPSRSLKQQIVSLMARRGLQCGEDQIFLTNGAQQGLSLLARLLLEHGGEVLSDEVTYFGFKQLLEPFEPSVLTVPTDLETGMDVSAVESLLASGARPAFIYAIPEGHNPVGVSLSPQKRVHLVELARRYQTPIVEDDAYGFLHYEGSSEPPLRALDDRWVLYVGSFSKTLAPALRVGWLVVPEALVPKLSFAKEASDVNTRTLAQGIVSAYLGSGHFDGQLDTLRREYRLRRDAMLDALQEYFPSEVRCSKPNSGLFVWTELPFVVDTSELLKEAVETEGVAFIPGDIFSMSPNSSASHCMRLSFSNCPPERVREGVARLARVVKRA